MSKYRELYKCRLCGEVLGRYEVDEAEAIRLPIRVIEEKTVIRHTCKDGSIGMADFQGYRKVQ